MKQTTVRSFVHRILGLGMIGIFCLLMSGCGSDSSPVNGTNSPILVTNNGITGTALLYPALGSDTPTPLANATIIVRPENGGLEIARQQTDSQGKFRFTLLQGNYILMPLPDAANHLTPTGNPQNVSVRTGQFTEVTVGFVQNTL